MKDLFCHDFCGSYNAQIAPEQRNEWKGLRFESKIGNIPWPRLARWAFGVLMVFEQFVQHVTSPPTLLALYPWARRASLRSHSLAPLSHIALASEPA